VAEGGGGVGGLEGWRRRGRGCQKQAKLRFAAVMLHVLCCAMPSCAMMRARVRGDDGGEGH
jgi:hypothetical protein